MNHNILKENLLNPADFNQKKREFYLLKNVAHS